MKIFFVRHGQTEWNKLGKFQGSKDSPLTTEGVIQAEKLAHKLHQDEIFFHKVYSSPLGRAFNTSKIITQEKYSINTIDEFKEISVGDMEGVIFSEFESKYPQEFHSFFNSPVDYNPKAINGETFLSLMERIQKGLDIITKENPLNSNILVVTHGITLKGILSYVTNNGIFLEQFSREPVPENTSVTTVKYEKGKFSILDFSNTEHLKKKNQ